jgi:hypothetical protein
LPLYFPQTGATATASFTNLSLDPNASLVVETESTAPAVNVGWLDVQTSAAVQGFTIFRQRVPGVPDSEGTVPLDASASPYFYLPFDNTNGFQTGIALANQSTSAVTITVLVRDDNGNLIGSSQIPLSRFGHGAFFSNNIFASTANRRGVLEFRSDGGNITGTGLRFSPTLSFTSVPIIR